jgi:adenylate kinase family enzyme
MNEYDFSKLNDKEFEALSIDLIAKLEGRRVERFKPGKDAGVDGRFFATQNLEVVIQCKHWVRSGLAALLRSLKNTEAAKVVKLKPSRYLFVTSLELSRQNKKTISNIFAPNIKSESDILGKEDLNSLLSEYREIEEKHYKLWLSSTNVLKIILNAAIIGRSSFKIDEITDFSSKYVRTNEHDLALQKLESLRAIIITGEPGIGKTTLADHICLNYVIDGYQLCYIEDSIAEAEELFNREKKQLFYFDDFLGRNYLMALGRHEDSHVINFIKRIGKSKNKRFILTSRSTVLNQGKRLSDLFRVENIDRNEYELNIKDLTGIEKAKILYNHIWFSELEPQFIDELYVDKRYKKIIENENYNPRLISFVTDAHKIAQIDSQKYWNYIENTLENPADTWGHVYDNQLDEHSRILIRLVAFNGRSIKEDKLRQSFVNYSKSNHITAGAAEFNLSIKLAVGAVLNRIITSGGDDATYDLFNPALGDYLLSRYREDENILFEVFKALHTIDSLENIKSLLDNSVIDKVIVKAVLSRLFNYYLSHKEHAFSGYIVKLVFLTITNVNLEHANLEQLKSWLVQLDVNLINPSEVGILFDSIKWAVDQKVIPSSQLKLNDLFGSLLTNDLEHYDYLSIDKFLAIQSDEYRDEYSPRLKRLIIDYWRDLIDQDIANSGKLDEFLYDEEEDSANDVLSDHVADILGEFSLDFDGGDIEAICEYCDVWSFIESNRENAAMSDDHREHGRTGNYSAESEDVAIDNLFERT